jgi:hypothetical protein
MNSLFGDATTMAPTPETLAEAESLFGDARSPVPSFRLGDDRVDGSNIDPNVPDLDIDPPAVEIQDGKPILKDSDREEGVGGWISNLVKKGNGDAGSGKYKRVGQHE